MNGIRTGKLNRKVCAWLARGGSAAVGNSSMGSGTPRQAWLNYHDEGRSRKVCGWLTRGGIVAAEISDPM